MSLLLDSRLVLRETKTAYRDIALFPVGKIDYPYPISTVFSTQPDPTQILPNHRSSTSVPVLSALTFVDYRYNRFALDPRTGLFSMIQYVSVGGTMLRSEYEVTDNALKGTGGIPPGPTSLRCRTGCRKMYRSRGQHYLVPI